MNRWMDGQTNGQTDSYMDEWTDSRQMDRKTDRQTVTKTARQTDRQTSRETDRHSVKQTAEHWQTDRATPYLALPCGGSDGGSVSTRESGLRSELCPAGMQDMDTSTAGQRSRMGVWQYGNDCMSTWNRNECMVV